MLCCFLMKVRYVNLPSYSRMTSLGIESKSSRDAFPTPFHTIKRSQLHITHVMNVGIPRSALSSIPTASGLALALTPSKFFLTKKSLGKLSLYHNSCAAIHDLSSSNRGAVDLQRRSAPRTHNANFEASSGRVSGGMSARSVAAEAIRMKKAYRERNDTKIVQKARRMLLSTSLDTGPQVEPREVADLLSAATYFGLANECPLVRQCVAWCKEHERDIQGDTLAPVVHACAVLKDPHSTELIATLSIRAMRLSRYLDAKAVANLLLAFSRAGVLKDKLAMFLTKRFVTLAKIGEFNAKLLVQIVDALAQSRCSNAAVRSVLVRRIASLRETFQVHELVPLVVSLARIHLRDEKTLKRLAAKSVDLAEQMSATHVCTLFQAFAHFGVKYDQLFGVLTNRAVELMDEFTAKHIALTLSSFQKISISNPELFDNLAERSMSVMAEHDASDVVHVLNALVHFGISDEELLRRLCEHSMNIQNLITHRQLVDLVYACAKIRYRHHDFISFAVKKVPHMANVMNAKEARKILWSLSRIGEADEDNELYTKAYQRAVKLSFGRASALYFEFLQDPEGTEEIEDIFDKFGSAIAPDLYKLYVDKGAETNEEA